MNDVDSGIVGYTIYEELEETKKELEETKSELEETQSDLDWVSRENELLEEKLNELPDIGDLEYEAKFRAMECLKRHLNQDSKMTKELEEYLDDFIRWYLKEA